MSIDADAERVRAHVLAGLDGAPALRARAEVRRALPELLGGAGEAPFVASVKVAPGPVDLPALGVPLGPRPGGEITTEIEARFALADTVPTGAIEVAPGEARLPDGLPGDLHPVSPPSDVVVHRGDAPAGDGPSALATFLDRLRARVTIEAPGDFWIRSEAAPEQRSASDERRRAEARAGAELEGGMER